MPGLIRWRRKRSLVPSAGPFPKLSVSRGVMARMGDRRWPPITSRRQTMAKNGPGVALNRPQDTERYNAKDSIVRRAVKCFCLVSKTKWAMLGVLRPFIPAVLPAHHLVTSSSIWERWRSQIIRGVAETAERILSGIKRGNRIIAMITLSWINNYRYLLQHCNKVYNFVFFLRYSFLQKIVMIYVLTN